jgi:hypothetical protein
LGLSGPDEAYDNRSRPASRALTCFDVLLLIPHDRKFVSTCESSRLVAKCYEIVLRVYKACEGIHRLDFVARKLRSVDFWRVGLSVLVNAYAKDSPSEHDMLHSMAWLLKCVAFEIELSLNPAFGLRLQSSLDETISFLLEPHADGLSDVVRLIPLVKVPVESDRLAFLSEEAVRTAKRQLPGASEVALGYEIVDFEHLCQFLGENKDATGNQALLMWTKQWNRSIQRDCATAHISKAVYLVLASISVALKSRTRHLAAVDIRGSQLFKEILAVLTSTDTSRSQSNLDDALYTTATRSLAEAALEASFVMQASQIELITLDLLAHSIALSGGNGRGNRDSESRADERTAILATALCIQLDTLKANQSDLAESIDWAGTGFALARLACHKPSTEPHSTTMIARACLSSLLEAKAFGDGPGQLDFLMHPINFDQGSTSRLPQPTYMHLLVHAITWLDHDVAHLLQKVALTPSGSECLQNCNVLHALDSAAVRYMAEESNCEQRNGSIGMNSELLLPTFLKGHLDLMTAIMLYTGDSESSCSIASQVSNILSRYFLVFERALTNFPREGDLLRSVFHCLAQAKLVLRFSGPSEYLVSRIGSRPPEQPHSPNSFEKRSVALLMHIAEQLLPESLLPSLRPAVVPVSQQMSILRFTEADRKCWWDGIDITGFVPHAIAGADVLRAGLTMLGHDWPTFIDVDHLARAICRCVESIKVSDDRDGTVQLMHKPLTHSTFSILTQVIDGLKTHTSVAFSPSPGSVDEEAKVLRSYIVDAILQLLIACIRLVRKVRSGDYPPSENAMILGASKTLTLALDMCRLDTQVRRFLRLLAAVSTVAHHVPYCPPNRKSSRFHRAMKTKLGRLLSRFWRWHFEKN